MVAVVWVALVGALLVPAPARAAASYTFVGHGYGHGRGMSQYGAQGAALRGLSAQQILNFYYPGTQASTVGGQIRVQLSADTDGDTNVAHTTGLRVHWLSDGVVTPLPQAGRWRLRAVGAQTTLESSNGSGWVGYLTRGGIAEFQAAAPITLRTSAGDRTYRGNLRQIGGDTVNVLGLDSYLQGVVAREMPASWRPAALQSQAIAARTYAVRLRQLNTSRSYDICDTTSCQVYGGLADEATATNTAIAATSGQIRTYQGAPALTQYASSSGGHTVSGGVPYLPAQADPYDGFAGNPVHSWSRTITPGTLAQAFPGIGEIVAITVTSRSGGGEWGGRAARVLVRGTRGSASVTGAAVRSRLGLRSDWFAIGGQVEISGAAAQINAAYRALGGKKRLGRARGPVRLVSVGAFRAYRKGRIYWSPDTGAVVLRGRILRAYLRRGGPIGYLGFPATSPRRVARGWTATFQHGSLVISSRRVG